MAQINKPMQGIALKITAVTLFTCMAALIKASASEVPAGEAMFFRAFFALPVIVIWLSWRGELREGLIPAQPIAHVWRGTVGGTAMGFRFTALGLMPLPEATALSYATPLFIVIFAAMFLDERVGLFRLGTVALGMVGVTIVLLPQLSVGMDQIDMTLRFGAMAMLASATFAGLAQVYVRKMMKTESTSATVFWFGVFVAVLSLFTLPFGWVLPSPMTALMLIGAGLIGGTAQVFLTAAYRNANASLVAPFDYASMFMAIFIGYFAFDEVPGWTTLIGVSVIITAGVLIIWRESRLGLKRDQRKLDSTQG